MTETQNARLREIKQSFRLMMNGVAAQSMRQKGLCYHLNWGVSLPDLKRLAAQYEKDGALADALMQENIRECKLLAPMLMPPKEATIETARRWMPLMPTAEVVECAVHALFRHAAEAPRLAQEWMASPEELSQVGGFQLQTSLLRKGLRLEAPERDALKKLAETAAASSPSMAVRRAASNCILALSEES